MKKLIIILFSLHASLFTVHPVNAQGCLPEGITFHHQTEIDSFQVNYPGCTEIEGGVTVYDFMPYDIHNLQGLSGITSIGGDLHIFSTRYLTNLTGLDSLTSLSGGLGISGNYTLTDLTALNSLNTIGGTLDISENEDLTSLSGLDNLNSIGGDLIIGHIFGGSSSSSGRYSSSLSSLTGLNALTAIGGNLIIYGEDALISLDALENLTSIGGSLEIGSYSRYDYIDGNDALTSLSGLGNIDASSINSLYITGNSSLSSCDAQSICDYLANPNGSINIYGNAAGCNNPIEVASECGITISCLPFGNYYFSTQSEIDSFQNNFPGCNDLAGNVQIGGNDIENLLGLNNLVSIGGSLKINNNKSLTSLTGLDSLHLVGGPLQIGTEDWPDTANMVLTDISALENIDAGSIEGLQIEGNPFLSECAIISICDYLADPTGWISINNNAAGCYTEEEVEAACLMGVPEESAVGSRQSAVVSYPNPTSGIVNLQFTVYDLQSIDLRIYNVQGQEVAVLPDQELAAGEHVVTWDAGGLPAGIYFYRLAVGGQQSAVNGKIVKY